MRLREHEGIIPGRIDILSCRPEEIKVQDGYNVRDLTTVEARNELNELKAQIKENGILTPLKVRFNGTDIILVEGHRRLTVALELIEEYKASGGLQGRFVEAVPIFAEALGTSDIDRDVGLEVSNSGSRLKPLELANLIHRLNTKHGLPLEEVAKRLGKSLPVIRNHLEMRAMPEPVKEHVRQGNIADRRAARDSRKLKFCPRLGGSGAGDQKWNMQQQLSLVARIRGMQSQEPLPRPWWALFPPLRN